jgi:hypothetical protein
MDTGLMANVSKAQNTSFCQEPQSKPVWSRGILTEEDFLYLEEEKGARTCSNKQQSRQWQQEE